MSDKTTRWSIIENHIRSLAFLMTERGTPSPEVAEYLDACEYGLALAALADEVVNHGR